MICLGATAAYHLERSGLEMVCSVGQLKISQWQQRGPHLLMGVLQKKYKASPFEEQPLDMRVTCMVRGGRQRAS